MSGTRAEAPQVPMTVLSKENDALIAEGNKRFDDAIEALRTARAKEAVAGLKYRWQMGKIAECLFNEKAKAFHERTYGEHVFEDVAEKCQESTATVWASIYLVSLYKEEDIDHFVRINLPWRGLAHLLSVRETNVREAFIKKWEDGKFESSDDLKTAIVEHNKKMRAKAKKDGKPGRQGGAGKYTRKFQSAEKALVDLTGVIMPEFLDLLSTWKEDDDVRASKDDTVTSLEKISEIIPTLETMLASAKKVIERGLKSKT